MFGPEPLVKRICGVLYPSQDERYFEWALNELEKLWGKADLISEPVPFDRTDYYYDISPSLTRKFICTTGLVKAGGLVEWKYATHELEEISKNLFNNNREIRAINLDPGYIDGARLVLASTKDHAHRIWLHDGIYAEITMRYRFNSWASFDYTFPDFKSGVYDEFLSSVRNLWLQERKKI